jgi:hypothetical protein
MALSLQQDLSLTLYEVKRRKRRCVVVGFEGERCMDEVWKTMSNGESWDARTQPEVVGQSQIQDSGGRVVQTRGT